MAIASNLSCSPGPEFGNIDAQRFEVVLEIDELFVRPVQDVDGAGDCITEIYEALRAVLEIPLQDRCAAEAFPSLKRCLARLCETLTERFECGFRVLGRAAGLLERQPEGLDRI